MKVSQSLTAEIVLLGIVLLLPMILAGNLWLGMLKGGRSNAWDGSGHQASAQQYSQNIFPDVFGWSNAQFGGLPYPNFYPPVFNWCVALLDRSHLLSFDSAFKFVIILSVVLLPFTIWMLGRAVFPKSRLVAGSAMLASLALLYDSRFFLRLPAGLDYFSTFQLGLYTQTLGFIFLALWYVAFLKVREKRWRFSLACVLLALTILSSFFSAVTAAMFIFAALASDLVDIFRNHEPGDRRRAFLTFKVRLLSSVLGVSLAGLWLVPMASEYEYFVTRPQVVQLGNYITPLLWCWFGVAILGGFLWCRQPIPAMWLYLGACAMLAGGLSLSSLFSPGWFSLQGPRFLIILIVLLSVPVGIALAAAFRAIDRLIGKLSERWQAAKFHQTPYTVGMALAIILLFWLSSPGLKIGYSFYPSDGQSELSGILQFAQDHRDGRYLVEVPQARETKARFDGRAINAYLSAQGNETLSSVYHEASVNSLFFLSVVNAFSGAPYHFGVSSVLADDLDFLAQAPREHLERARLIGTRYLVIYSYWAKMRLSQEAGVGTRHDFGRWSIFELNEQPPPRARCLIFPRSFSAASLPKSADVMNPASYAGLKSSLRADGSTFSWRVRVSRRSIS